MAIDTQVPLQANPPPDFLTQQRGMVSLQEMMLQLQQQQQQAQGRNQLRALFQQPGSVDASGNVTPQAIGGATRIDPMTGMELQRNAILLNSDRMKVATAQQQRSIAMQGIVDPVRGQSLAAYDEVIKKGGSVEAATAAGQRVLTEGLAPIRDGGLLSDQEKAQLRSNFDYGQMKQNHDWFQRYQAQGVQPRTAEQVALTQFKNENPNASSADIQSFVAGLKKDEKGLADTGWQVLTDPGNKDASGNPTTYRYNPRTAQATTLAGAPYTPSSAAKLSGGSGGSGTISPENLDYFAQTYREKGTLPPMYRDQQSRSAILNRAAEMARSEGKGAADDVAGQARVKADTTSLASLTKMTDSAVSFENTALKNMTVVEGLMDKGSGTAAGPIINRWLQAGRKATGDSDVAAFNVAMNTVANEYAKIMSGSTGSMAATEGARAEAQAMVNAADSPAQIKKVFDTMRKDMENRKTSLVEQRDTISSRISGKGKEAAPAAPAAAPSGGFIEGQVYRDAKGNKAKWQNGAWVEVK